MKVRDKCSRCGAPINWSKSTVIKQCEYCGKPFSQTSQYFIGIKDVLSKVKITFNRIPFPSKERVNEQKRILLEKQNLLTEDQIAFLGGKINRLFSKKRNILILLAIPISFISYLKINYPQRAKPYYPDFPYRLPTTEETGEFIFYADNQSREFLIFHKFWCKNYRKTTPLAKCLKNNYMLEKSYFDIGSEKKEEDWFIYKLAKSTRDNQPSTKDMLDVAINCKNGLISLYENLGLSYLKKIKSLYPSPTDYEEEQQFDRRKPTRVMRKMGKLWWASGDMSEDLESGKYLAYRENLIKKLKSDLSKELSKKSPTKRDLENINSIRSRLKRIKNHLLYEKYSRNALRKNYTNLFKKVCKQGPLGLF